MDQLSQIQLKTSCVTTVPLQVYNNDFSFIVNGEEFKTSKIISDLLSPVICQIHSNDPIFDTFIINTQERGNFSHILNLLNFKPNNIPNNEIPFFLEIIEILGISSIEYQCPKESTEITIDNVFTLLKQHEKHPQFYHNRFSSEIEFISSHFSELCEDKEEELTKLSIDTLIKILSNENLQLETEDQLLKFSNKLYSNDAKYSILYETVLFENVTSDSMKIFTSIYDMNDLTSSTWNRLSKRLEQDSPNKNEKSSEKNKRYKNVKERGIEFQWSDQNEFKGIIHYLREKSNNQIENEINITASTTVNNSECYQPRCVVLFEDQQHFFHSQNVENNWLCFDFKEKRVIPTHYTVRSYPSGANAHHPKTWVIEGSNDNSSWDKIDEEVNCAHLNGLNVSHTFEMNKQNSNEYKYIRMRLTGPNWANYNYLMVDSFEIYGRLIQPSS